MKQTGIGVVGCGMISGIYLKNLTRVFQNTRVVACAALHPERAQARAAEFDVPRACSVDELMRDPEVEVVLNLTVPNAHASVSLAALEAGKHVYLEKPLASSREEGLRVLETARRGELRVGGAPDTFLGSGLQTCRKLIDDGEIGKPIGATAFFANHGWEWGHPDPEFFYKRGGGPIFDMGPYYLTALIALLGPVARVTGSTRTTFSERTITSEPKSGQKIEVEVPTHVSGVLEFASGAVGMILMSYDIYGHHLPKIEIHGTEGSLSVPDPNKFGGPILLRKKGEKEWRDAPLAFGYQEDSRGIGVADMVDAIATGRPHRASGKLMHHVVDIAESLYDASRIGKHQTVTSVCERPAPLDLDLAPGEIR